MNILSTQMIGFWIIIPCILVVFITFVFFAQLRNALKTYYFFTPYGVDERILSLTERDLKSFHPSEQEFVRWYQVEKKNGMKQFHLTMNTKDLSFFSSTNQVALCAKIMRMNKATTVPDPEIF